MMGFYRTKPVAVRALQWDGASRDDPSASALTYHFPDLPHTHLVAVGNRLQVVTDHGTVMADMGDWIVQWPSMSLSVVREKDFDRQFDVDERMARIRSWKEPPRLKPRST